MYANENILHLLLFKTGLLCEFQQLASTMMSQLLGLTFALQPGLMEQRITSSLTDHFSPDRSHYLLDVVQHVEIDASVQKNCL